MQDLENITSKLKLFVFSKKLRKLFWIAFLLLASYISVASVISLKSFTKLNKNRIIEKKINQHNPYLINLFKSTIQRPRYDVDCKQIINQNKSEIDSAKSILEDLRKTGGESIKLLDDSNFIFPKSLCEAYKEIRLGNRPFYNKQQTSNSISIAYTILLHNDVEQFERFLMAIYHPNNVYCVHIDSKSSDSIKNGVRSIVDCFDNVFIATKLEYIIYSGFSRLKADLNCINDLLNLTNLVDKHENLMGKRNVDWNYSMNVVSTEFPLRTYQELSQILTMYNGSNDVEIVRNFERLDYRIKTSWAEDNKKNQMIKSDKPKSDPQHYDIAKGYAYTVLHRKFVTYALTDPRALGFLKWLEDTYAPDELYWATLQFNTNLFPDSGFIYLNETKIDTMSLYAEWVYEGKNCKGLNLHSICVFSVEDLAKLVKLKNFIFNKFKLDYDPIAYQCAEEWFYEREAKNVSADMDFYCKWIKPHSSLANC